MADSMALGDYDYKYIVDSRPTGAKRPSVSGPNVKKKKKMAAILSLRQFFLPEVIPEVEYTRKIAMRISDILSFSSTL